MTSLDSVLAGELSIKKAVSYCYAGMFDYDQIKQQWLKAKNSVFSAMGQIQYSFTADGQIALISNNQIDLFSKLNFKFSKNFE